jgi:hypothetical protein
MLGLRARSGNRIGAPAIRPAARGNARGPLALDHVLYSPSPRRVTWVDRFDARTLAAETPTPSSSVALGDGVGRELGMALMQRPPIGDEVGRGQDQRRIVGARGIVFVAGRRLDAFAVGAKSALKLVVGQRVADQLLQGGIGDQAAYKLLAVGEKELNPPGRCECGFGNWSREGDASSLYVGQKRRLAIKVPQLAPGKSPPAPAATDAWRFACRWLRRYDAQHPGEATEGGARPNPSDAPECRPA